MRRELSPALAGSVLLHGAVAAALLISWNFSRNLKVGAVVPVTIVTNASTTDLAPAVEAPVEQTAQAETPVPQAPLEPVPAPQPTPQPPAPAPAPAPRPVPQRPTPTPAPAVKTPTPQPAPKAAQPAKPTPPAPAAKAQPKADKGLDFDALLASINKNAKSGGGRPSSAPKSETRPATAPQARPNLGSGQAAAALSGLTEELQRRWNPNCEVEGARDVLVRVTFKIGPGGQVVGDVGSSITRGQGAVAQASADRAVRAVYAASPFRQLPRDFYGQSVVVNFNAREACS